MCSYHAFHSSHWNFYMPGPKISVLKSPYFHSVNANIPPFAISFFPSPTSSILCTNTDARLVHTRVFIKQASNIAKSKKSERPVGEKDLFPGFQMHVGPAELASKVQGARTKERVYYTLGWGGWSSETGWRRGSDGTETKQLKTSPWKKTALWILREQEGINCLQDTVAILICIRTRSYSYPGEARELEK